MKIKIISLFIILLLIIPGTLAAFHDKNLKTGIIDKSVSTNALTLKVNCQQSIVAPETVLTCTLDLSKDVAESFGIQFKISAPGFFKASPFFTKASDLAGDCVDLEKNCLIYNGAGGGAKKGAVATIKLIAPKDIGEFTISLTDLVNLDGAISDKVSVSLGSEVCTDGKDNDGDFDVDCIDTDCLDKTFSVNGVDVTCEKPSEKSCADGFDNDGDGAKDCNDPSCAGVIVGEGKQCQNPEATCDDGFDNDNDGNIDCDDGNCAGHTSCVPAVCGNGVLEKEEACDGNGFIDKSAQLCSSYGFKGGAVTCGSDCQLKYDTCEFSQEGESCKPPELPRLTSTCASGLTCVEVPAAANTQIYTCIKEEVPPDDVALGFTIPLTVEVSSSAQENLFQKIRVILDDDSQYPSTFIKVSAIAAAFRDYFTPASGSSSP